MPSARVSGTNRTTSHPRRQPASPGCKGEKAEAGPLNPAWLRTFVEVYRTGSFGKAAHRLHISQPAVTQQIRMLEERVGVPLFVRHATGSRPTPAAESLARDAEGPVDALDFVLQRYFGVEGPSRPLRLGAPSDLVSDRILPALADMLRERVQLRTTLALSDALLAQLAAGELDIVVARERPRLKGIAALPLYDEECSLVASPETAREIPPDLSPAEAPRVLAAHPLVAFAESLPMIDHYWWSVFHAPPATAPDVVVPDHRAVLAAVRASVGITVVPTYLCAEDFACGTLVPLLTPELPPITTMYLATREGDVARPHVSAAHGKLLACGRTWS
ncbi:LysR family transcriptional regulator [Streptomyces sp. NPDC048638]|uniref:LysR family transcriptional regulator n=1 Tax=Streptomyces sp. NPDC048638 TaxID=3365580 RepID=UPI003713CB47